jgi:hypothetical protein
MNGFTGHVANWWRWLSQHSKYDMLRDTKEYEAILQALTKQFYGIEVSTDAKHVASLFMS